MNKSEWESVQKAIESPGGWAKLLVDSYEVDLILLPVSAYKKEIAVYVNGYIKQEWILGKTPQGEEIRRRFYCEHKKCLIKKPNEKMTRKEIQAFEKAKKQYTYSYYLPYWSSFSSLRRHFVKNNQSIEIRKEVDGNDNKKDQQIRNGSNTEGTQGRAGYPGRNSS